MQEGEILGFVGDWLSKTLPPKLHNPIFECPVCMGFWYGSIAYWIVYHNSIREWVIIAVCTVGFNAIIDNLFITKTKENG